jgi:hypothetical protein
LSLVAVLGPLALLSPALAQDVEIKKELDPAMKDFTVFWRHAMEDRRDREWTGQQAGLTQNEAEQYAQKLRDDNKLTDRPGLKVIAIKIKGPFQTTKGTIEKNKKSGEQRAGESGGGSAGNIDDMRGKGKPIADATDELEKRKRRLEELRQRIAKDKSRLSKAGQPIADEQIKAINRNIDQYNKLVDELNEFTRGNPSLREPPGERLSLVRRSDLTDDTSKYVGEWVSSFRGSERHRWNLKADRTVTYRFSNSVARGSWSLRDNTLVIEIPAQDLGNNTVWGSDSTFAIDLRSMEVKMDGKPFVNNYGRDKGWELRPPTGYSK